MSTNAAPPSLGRAEVPIGPRPLPAPPASQYGRFSALADTDFNAAVNAAVGIDGDAGGVRWSEVMDNEEGNARAAAPAPVPDAATSSSTAAARPSSGRGRGGTLAPVAAIPLRTSPRFAGTTHSAQARQAAAALAQSEGRTAAERAPRPSPADLNPESATPPSAQPPMREQQQQHQQQQQQTTEQAALESARTFLEGAADRQRAAAAARTKAYAGLFSHLEKMCADGHVDSHDLEALLATAKACHRRGEANGYAPPFPRPMIQMYSEYAPKDPLRSVNLAMPRLPAQIPASLQPGPHRQHHAQDVRPAAHAWAPGAYSAAAARGGASIPAPPAPSSPFAHLRDRRIVGRGEGSALAAALRGGRSADRLLARTPPDAASRKKDPILLVRLINEALAEANAPPHVRVDVVSPCPTGLSIMPRIGCALDQLSAYKDKISSALGALKVDENEQWERWVIHGVPTHAGSGQIDSEFLQKELGTAFPSVLRGDVARLCKREEDWSAKEFTPVAFFTTTKANLTEGQPIRILGRIFLLRRYRLRPDSTMCGSCGSYRHRTADCHSTDRCRRCAQHGHKEEEHSLCGLGLTWPLEPSGGERGTTTFLVP